MHSSDIVKKIRESERISHEQMYSEAKLYRDNGWLQKPVKTVVDLLPLFQNSAHLHFLDLGCGIGRNSIYIANYFSDRDCVIDCVDILEMAIDHLNGYAKEHGVESLIQGFISSIEDYDIAPQQYDCILAVSALEHLASKEEFLRKLAQISNGLCKGGVVCLIINSEIAERNLATGKEEIPQFELLFSCEELDHLLFQSFDGWTIRKHTHRAQRYEIPRNGNVHELSTTVVTFVAQKPDM